MWHKDVESWLLSAWIVTVILAFLLPYARGYSTAIWVAPLTITAFCVGLYLGIESMVRWAF